MNHTNIISAYQSILAIENSIIDKTKFERLLNFKIHEAETLKKFCNEILLNHNTIPFDIFDGYYLSYTIKQIGKEFDLLRFGKNSILNIELKSELNLSQSEKIIKINNQMKKNYYYLKALNKKVKIYTYVLNDGLYVYDHLLNSTDKADFDVLVQILAAQSVDYDVNPDGLFTPNKYLISPFNNTTRFMEESYFLNDAQQKIKNAILSDFTGGKKTYFCVSANAGTGKTLLLYDIVKTLLKESRNPIIIHCGNLNPGQCDLIFKYNWSIKAIKNIKFNTIESGIPANTDVILIDESQRISDWQLDMIIKRAKELNCMVVFSYDNKQFLRVGEDKDIDIYLESNYPEVKRKKESLTNKIRTNKEIASFITNLMQIGKSNSDLNYKNITITYFDEYDDAQCYMEFLRDNQGWTPLTFSDSLKTPESISRLANMKYNGFTNAHFVIGQEFDKVVFAMDKNFRYNNGRLQGAKTYYSLEGMLYQIVTRVINELKIIVIDNPELYSKLLEIKSLDLTSNNI